MPLIRATLVSFNPATYLATVRADGSDPQAFDSVTVSSAIRPEVLLPGRRVIVDTGLTGEAGELLLIAIDGLYDRAIARDAALLDVVNTAAETTLLSATVPANTLSTNRAVRLTLTGDYLNNSGANQTLTLRLKYGATTLYNDVTAVIATNAARRALRVEALLAAANSATAQALGGLISISAPGGTTNGLGDLGVAALTTTPITGAAVENSATALAFALTAQHGAANASLSVRRLYAAFEPV
jgi:hypothetical protein